MSPCGISTVAGWPPLPSRTSRTWGPRFEPREAVRAALMALWAERPDGETVRHISVNAKTRRSKGAGWEGSSSRTALSGKPVSWRAILIPAHVAWYPESVGGSRPSGDRSPRTPESTPSRAAVNALTLPMEARHAPCEGRASDLGRVAGAGPFRPTGQAARPGARPGPWWPIAEGSMACRSTRS